MVKGIISGILLLSSTVIAQRELYVRPGLISSGLTFSPSIMLNHPQTNYYVSGHLQGRLDQHFSLRGETFYYAGGIGDNPYFRFNSRTFFGFLAHLNKGNLDSHLGLMPGISVMQINDPGNVGGNLPYQVVPSLAANIGVTYYVWKFFNFFANITYVHSTARVAIQRNGQADELMISAGLGLNFNAVRAK
ncbi:MAG: hypothetical protein A3D92_23870 [Bacteroidetes bacterium RIFCSPHIGHO2_02_FULL_44_7]|nr:MAG: hypothetical protein A3D92_23870 [Bacteroidetes bacterium RIFCSPHIGHO2_02_FULL_44_7]